MTPIGQFEINASDFKKSPDKSDLPILATRNLVLFPGVTIPISITRENSLALVEAASNEKFPVGVVCQINASDESPTVTRGLHKIGCVADIFKVIPMPDGSVTAIIHGRERFRILGKGKGEVFPGVLSAKVELLSEEKLESERAAYMKRIKTMESDAREVLTKTHNGDSTLASTILSIEDPYERLNNLITNLMADDPAEKIEVLAQDPGPGRADAAFGVLLRIKERMNLYESIVERSSVKMSDRQREAFLMSQLETIREELYGEENVDSDFEDLYRRADATAMPPMVRETFNKELAKLRRLNISSPDYSVQYAYLETLLDIPWIADSVDTDIMKARRVLEESHYGLNKINQRILEQLAVALSTKKKVKTPILCLVGPPGVGKTSLGKSIAAAMGRRYRRVALGGVHDESEIRGHRRTYIGAMPGRIIKALREAGATNPVLLLDEVDKLGHDHRGDPAAALLEVLDPEQNSTFHDNYIEVDVDLSDVLFIATANDISKVDGPLRDRMEIIELSGYLPEEKIEIAKRHLIPKVLKENGMANTRTFRISDEAIMAIIERYTAESGVRSLEKNIATLVRKLILARLTAKTESPRKRPDFPKVVEPEHLISLLGKPAFSKDEYEGNEMPGVATGLAWTAAGGAILLAEVSLTPGKGDRVSITGNLGDVMKESASIALQWVKANADDLGIKDDEFEKRNVHIHFPEGAIPKDGPSAGITIATAIVSAFTRRSVMSRLAMTGEITLRGKVLPVGGIREKILAARRAGITSIILPAKNRIDVEEIPANYVEGLTFHYVDTVGRVMEIALGIKC